MFWFVTCGVYFDWFACVLCKSRCVLRVVCYGLFSVLCVLLAGCSLVVVGSWLLCVVCCLMCGVWCSLFAVCCLLLCGCCLLFNVYCL